MSSRIAVFSPYTEHVGTEGAMLRLARGISAAGFKVDLLRAYREWPDVPEENIRVVDIGTRLTTVGIDRLPFPWKKFLLAATSYAGLVRYLRREEPDVIVGGLLNAVALAARQTAGVDTAVICSIQGLPQQDHLRSFLWPRLYPRADAIVSPVDSVAARTAEIAGINQEEVTVIPNPVITEELLKQRGQVPDHEWYHDDDPVVTAVGRQTRQKDFETLLRAFDQARNAYDGTVRLVIPGKDGEQASHLRTVISELELGDHVDFPGFVDDVYPYMAEADLFVLSSRWEGPGHVLVEALALGTPAVATKCPAGPEEILQHGDAGTLVPVGDQQAMADAITDLLTNKSKRTTYVDAGREAAKPFYEDRVTRAYLELIENILVDTVT